MADAENETKAGFVTLAGAPNAGKSTLMNQLVGAKVSIVSPKVQTTRARVIGIALHGPVQIAFVDTPGIFQPKRRLEKAMVDAAWGGVAEGDMTVLLIDAQRGITENVERILTNLAAQQKKIWVVLNKIDLVKKDNLLALASALGEMDHVEEIFMVSALTGDGVAHLLDRLAAKMQPGPWLYPEDQITEMPNRILTAEITREKLFLRLHQELPYALTVETEAWEERKDGSVKISQVIYVTRDGHKAIVLGKGGATIREIGRQAREELSEILERPVHLFTFVKVREKWLDDPARYREMGLDFPKG
ncbi:MAG: GTPase Era [Minwuia sp.]|uniref:GTPase Era n=1 Tax=Minwuia sp. TaxID=2493630 RepID=UPI003A84C020